MERSDLRVVVSTRRRDEASGLLARTFPDLRLEPVDDDAPFLFRHTSFGDSRMRANELIISGAATATGWIPRSDVGVGVVLAGHYAADYGRGRIDPDRPFLQPSVPADIRMRDAHLQLVTFDTDALRAVAERYESAGARHLRLVRTRPVSDEAAEAWRWVGHQVSETMRDARTAANPIVTAELFDLGVRVLLACFGEPDDRLPESLSASPSSVRRAVAYLEEHASEVVSVPDVAAAARVSVRSLQTLFRRHLGVTPLEHLHGIRLEAARRDLLDADSRQGTRSVQDVAVRWGFGNSGRFARIYAARFGERPSDTLRRRA